MRRPPILLDFAHTRPRLNRFGAALLIAGAAGVLLVAADYRSVAAQGAGLEARLGAIRPGSRAGVGSKAAGRAAEEAGAAVAELATPWSLLLQELEAAGADSKGSIAVLAVEPDREKRQVQVLAEARTLPIALAYVERLQKSRALRYPMLVNHEVQVKDAERPVRFQIRADWRIAP